MSRTRRAREHPFHDRIKVCLAAVRLLCCQTYRDCEKHGAAILC